MGCSQCDGTLYVMELAGPCREGGESQQRRRWSWPSASSGSVPVSDGDVCLLHFLE